MEETIETKWANMREERKDRKRKKENLISDPPHI
jgi:hypothetical protein